MPANQILYGIGAGFLAALGALLFRGVVRASRMLWDIFEGETKRDRDMEMMKHDVKEMRKDIVSLAMSVGRIERNQHERP